MNQGTSLDAVRAEALDRIERGERWFKIAFFGAAVFEMAFIAALLLAADLASRTDRLIVIATLGSYSMVLLGLVALGAYTNRAVLRVLKALDSVRRT